MHNHGEKSKPIVLVPACKKDSGISAFYRVGAKYADAIIDPADCLPVLIPAMADNVDPTPLLAMANGLLLTGSPSNVEPHRYNAGPTLPGDESDPARDETVLSLVPKAIELGIPVLGLCRGIQELNVALGGSINPAVHLSVGRMDHRSDKTIAQEQRYAPTHDVRLTAGGLLHKLLGSEQTAVNSLHAQAIDRLAPGLEIEAVADDGTIEAVRHSSTASFCLAVQWHPEWKPHTHPLYKAIFQAFGDACRQHQRQRGLHDIHRDVA